MTGEILLITYAVLCVALVCLQAYAVRDNINMKAAIKDIAAHAVWEDPFGQWWNVYRCRAFKTGKEAFDDLNQRLKGVELVYDR